MLCRGARRSVRWGRLLLAGLWLGALAGCLQVPPVLPPSRLPSATELLRRLEQQGQAVQTLKGVARTQLATPQGTESFTQVLLVERPDRLRAEVLGLFGQPGLILVSRGRELSIALPGAGRFYRGAASAENLQRFTGLPLDPPQLIALLVGAVPRRLSGPATVLATPTGGELRLEADGAREYYRFDAGQRLVAAGYLQDGTEWLRLGYGDFDPAGFPREVTLTLPEAALTASLRFTSLTVNGPVPQDRFVLPLPDGADLQPLP